MDYLTIKVVQTLLTIVPPYYLHKIVGEPSLEYYGSKEIKKFKTPPPNFNKVIKVDGLEEGKARWFTEVENRLEDDIVIVFLHGGGYSFPVFPGQAAFLTALVKMSKLRLSIVWLDYTLSSKHPFPKQLVEAANLYNALVAQNCRNIVLLGDSAGANLAVNLMRHIHQPFKNIPKVYLKPSAAILISPWLQLVLNEEEGSFAKYKWDDYITSKGLRNCTKLLLNEDHFPNCFELFGEVHKDKTIDWSSVLPKNVLVTYGEKEILRDSIEQFCSMAKINNVFCELNAVHDTPALFGPKKSKVTLEVLNFISKL